MCVCVIGVGVRVGWVGMCIGMCGVVVGGWVRRCVGGSVCVSVSGCTLG